MSAQISTRNQRISRSLILDCARVILEERGADAVSIRRIAEAIPCAPPSIYYYFRNKKAIIEALMVEPIEGLVEELANSDNMSAKSFLSSYGNYWLARPDKLRLLLLPSQGIDQSMLQSEQYALIEAKLAERLDGDLLQAEALLGAVNGMLLKLMVEAERDHSAAATKMTRYLTSLTA
ncbi:TetR/AcrR family transcriptional regulator [Salinibius halmophilus]|uniref:TetR/AcrR family transcriptional regulator n=1 Tax=Salinibius halmophilus TaxID=1853216 RepID=UPI000E666ADB|nr:TetR/AcrR family transcriptional regulator [Salinibius halmophilus]